MSPERRYNYPWPVTFHSHLESRYKRGSNKDGGALMDAIALFSHIAEFMSNSESFEPTDSHEVIQMIRETTPDNLTPLKESLGNLSLALSKNCDPVDRRFIKRLKNLTRSLTIVVRLRN